MGGINAEYMGKANNVSAEGLFKEMLPEDGKVDKSKFLTFVKKLPDAQTFGDEDMLSKLFANIDKDDDENLHLIEKDLSILVKHFYRVLKKTSLANACEIKVAKSTRLLDLDELVEHIEGPKKDEPTGAMRVLCRAVKDGAEGWVTMRGNTGGQFLETIKSSYVVKQDAPLTD